ncbi:beta-N-acetylhexosaminidase [Thalassotalea crassostreae]|uniref:beta-N-acetylhexosaminidase n=1 Tax=Thalassotalea crassostreae TaxID=1763536 RepID=UPI000838CAEB|nr:beta-N-acetylhexosaminidase [Thalassotalea crassostreae]
MSSLMIDVQGTSLNEEDKELIRHPNVAGLILFTRNFESVEQLTELNIQIKSHNPNILIAVDHEGGRVQRFRDGFSKIPAMGSIYKYAAQHFNTAEETLALAKKISLHMGYLMAAEVRAVGIDISFAPVLDVDNISDVILDRGFHRQPEIVTDLALSFIEGMNKAGMKATGKHFPGHGSVKEDSHIAMPNDTRKKADIFANDMQVFKDIITSGKLDAIMPAHVIYPDVDALPVGFSKYWLQQVLRQELGFEGVIFSDDLSMQGATSAGSYAERCEAADKAGCDMLLVCNDRVGQIQAIEQAKLTSCEQSNKRVQSMLSKNANELSMVKLQQQPLWQNCQRFLNS